MSDSELTGMEKLLGTIGLLAILILAMRILIPPGACIPLPGNTEYSAICFGIHAEPTTSPAGTFPKEGK